MLAYARWIERLRIVVERSRVLVDSKGLPPDGLRVLHLSDLHFTDRDLVERLKISRTLDRLVGEAYDLLVITGDLIHDDRGLPATLRLIEGLPQPRIGAFACLGNHDYAGYSWFGPARTAWREAEPGQRLQAALGRSVDMMARIIRNDRLYLGQDRNNVSAMVSALEARGVEVLRNRSVRLRCQGADLWLAGVDDLMEGEIALDETMKGLPEPGALRILLAHNPDWLLEPALQDFDIAFSGHVHGGQIQVPWLGALHTQGTHLSRRRPAGWFHYGRTATYVSRGLGEGVRLRFRCRPEVALIEVRARGQQ